MPNNFHDTFLFPSHRATISHPSLHLHYLLITNCVLLLPHPCSPLHSIPKQSFRPMTHHSLSHFQTLTPAQTITAFDEAPHLIRQSKDQVRLWWWWGGSPHGHRDLTLPILLIFSSRCSLTMVASSWPLPHLATVHHCRRD